VSEVRRLPTANGEWVAHVQGHGPALVLLHGLGSAGATWDRVAPLLAQRSRVVALDLPGHGVSRAAPSRFDIESIAESLDEALGQLRLHAPTVLGHSYGGALAMRYALDFRDRCRGLVLVNSAGFGLEVHPVLRALTRPGADRAVDALRRLPLSRLGRVGAAARSRDLPLDELLRLHGSLQTAEGRTALLSLLRSGVDIAGQRLGTDSPARLSGLPTLIVWGDPDPIIPVAHARAAQQLIAGSELAFLPGGGHAPHRRRPEELSTAVLGFLRAPSTGVGGTG
jgi:pimeloyl-ACP methyl ester carboxylesterase